ncbi:hypothetical protein [Streptoalloteichus hindustanus]|uniref:hypothetical protein n=1 Tax=Streptoalloteichus hindustanus TaxID=2017 RepID=UPI0011610AC0|nr:hypothetical protein [Streptoalloteichus hindustanus]
MVPLVIGGFVTLFGGLVLAEPSSSSPRHALGARGGGLSVADLLRRGDVRRPRASRRLARIRRQLADASTETLRRIDDALVRLRRINVAEGERAS